MQRPSLYTVLIQHIDLLTPHILHLACVVDGSPFSFSSGQYGTVIINQTTRRQYSFCSNPKKTDAFEFVIDTAPNGPGSQYFLSKKVGDTLQMLAPLGTFVFIPSPRKKVFIATGTGVAPLRSMILEHVATVPMTLYWGLRHETDMYWDKEFTELSKQYPTFQYNLVLSKPEGAWQRNVGHVTDQLERDTVAIDADYYVSGNRQMIADVKTLLLAHNVPEGQIKTELF